MIQGLFKNSSPVVKILLTLFAMVAGFAVFTLLGMLLSYMFFGTGFDSVSGNLSFDNAKNVAVLKLMQTCFSIGVFVFPPFMLAFLVSGKVGNYLGLKRSASFSQVIMAIMLVLFSIPLVNFLVMINESIRFPESLKWIENSFKSLENNAEKASTAFLKAPSFGQYLVNVFVIGLIPALGEELSFRGVFQKILHEWAKNIHVAIFISAFIFSAMHLQFYGFFARLLLGMLFGYLFYWSGSLWLPIIAHFFNNSFAVTLYYLRGDLAQKAEDIGTGREMLPSVVVSIIVVSLLLYSVYKSSKENTSGFSEAP